MDQGLKAKLLRSIPSVERLMEHPALGELGRRMPRWIVVDSVRQVLAETRAAIAEERLAREPHIEELAATVSERAAAGARRGIRKVINATGVVIHTNLGRSVLAEAAVAAAVEAARSYSSLEFDLARGRRSSRTEIVDGLAARIVGSEDAFVVNNNAGAVLLALNTLADGKDVIVSRGELVEIGGSFRLPDVMRKSGVRMVEVGTTNRTRLEDYQAVVNPSTAVILKVHPSNFALAGFVESPSRRELADLAHKHGLLMIEDLGSGALFDLARIGIAHEPMPQEAIADGVDVVTFSGDKLLGGPQAGLIVGKREPIGRMKSNPMARALRLDKLTLAALEETLRIYLEPEKLPERIPTLAMLASPASDLEARARRAAEAIRDRVGPGLKVSVERAASQVGGGSLPLANVETAAIVLVSSRLSPDELVTALRKCEIPIIARIGEDKVFLDFRTIPTRDDDLVVEEIAAALGSEAKQA
ncbi:MAG TPA: L-seryl-tRNA(Sec) selenium transferase [bacterium]|nr:L-seryl-tRNA(Sec) selenium transferase [bacterium]